MSGVSEGARGLPDPRLRAFVRSYQGYLMRGFDPGTHIGMPGTDLTVIVTIDEPLDIPVSPHPGQAPGTWETMASGLTVRPCSIAHRGFQHGIQLEVTPQGARALLGVPVAELGSWVIDLADLLGADVPELRERVSATSDWPKRFAILDEILLRRVADTAMDPNLRHAWRLLTAGSGQARVADVATEIGWSRRYLGSRFVAEFGITPKDAARLARFEFSHRLLRSVATAAGLSVYTPRRLDLSIAEVAAAAGYYDQAHMAREWRELAGMPPSTWLANEQFPFVQDRERLPLEGSAT
ncbi:helix-turn-helix domain-containing protein [Nocardia mexicana]|uniref:AraC family transcriptional regulator n=1 Tax=Nocardia mexicana TaxID=279262 RepID=A0A370H8U7_9NOCA|nr:helix-turn-helix domain-containing protein [Nocardia mexicana]RDI53105.1 AraC family transcriptional regulator [Nocardia mexicana]